MLKPKISVILNNFDVPIDRFTGYGGTPRAAVELIEVCGRQGVVAGVEMLAGDSPRFLNEGNKAEVKAALEHHGLALCSLLPITWNEPFVRGSMGSRDANTRRRAVDHVKRAVDLAGDLGCPHVGQWPGQDGWDYHFEVDYQAMYGWWVESMRELADHDPEIRLGLEAKPYEPRAYSFLDTTAKVLLLIQDIDRPNVGVLLDIGHAFYAHETLGQAVALAQQNGRRLYHLHLNDNHGEMDWDLAFGSVHFLGLLEFLYWLDRTGYEGWYSVDIFPYRTDPAGTIAESAHWIQTLFDLVERLGPANLGRLIQEGDWLTASRFFREALFPS